MRTELRGRPFPYVCHAVRPTSQGFIVAVLGVLVAVWAFSAARGFESMGAGWSLTYYAVAALGALTPIAAIAGEGVVDLLPNRVLRRGSAVFVLPVLVSPRGLLYLVLGAVLGAVGWANTFMDGPFTSERVGIVGLIIGPGNLLFAASTVVLYLWQRVRWIRMTPESLSYRRGFAGITLGWNQLGDAITATDIWDHESGRGHRDVTRHVPKYRPGAKIVIPSEKASTTRLPVWSDSEGKQRLLLDAEHFRVEPSALLTAILAMRDHPELREKLGTRESKAFFVGPPWRVRRHMYRTQRWWPEGAAPAGVEVDADGVVKEPVPRMEIR